jgi:hypothetical protein
MEFGVKTAFFGTRLQTDRQADATRGAAGATPEVRVALRRQPRGGETQVLRPSDHSKSGLFVRPSANG